MAAKRWVKVGMQVAAVLILQWLAVNALWQDSMGGHRREDIENVQGFAAVMVTFVFFAPTSMAVLSAIFAPRRRRMLTMTIMVLITPIAVAATLLVTRDLGIAHPLVVGFATWVLVTVPIGVIDDWPAEGVNANHALGSSEPAGAKQR